MKIVDEMLSDVGPELPSHTLKVPPVIDTAFPPLLPPNLKARLPAIGTTEKKDDPVAQVKFECGSWQWYVTEFDGKDILFGLVKGDESELRYFSLRALESIRKPRRVWRDQCFVPTPLSKL